jgi:hypothetical protein
MALNERFGGQRSNLGEQFVVAHERIARGVFTPDLRFNEETLQRLDLIWSG